MKWLIGKNSTFNFTSNHNRNFCAKSSSLNLHYFYVWSLFQKNVMANVFLSLPRLCDPSEMFYASGYANEEVWHLRMWESQSYDVHNSWQRYFSTGYPSFTPNKTAFRGICCQKYKKVRNRKKKKQLNVTLKKRQLHTGWPVVFPVTLLDVITRNKQPATWKTDKNNSHECEWWNSWVTFYELCESCFKCSSFLTQIALSSMEKSCQVYAAHDLDAYYISKLFSGVFTKSWQTLYKYICHVQPMSIVNMQM